MGNAQSTTNPLIPIGLFDCIDDNGDIDIGRYYLYRRHQQRQQDDEVDEILERCLKEAEREIVYTTAGLPFTNQWEWGLLLVVTGIHS